MHWCKLIRAIFVAILMGSINAQAAPKLRGVSAEAFYSQDAKGNLWGIGGRFDEGQTVVKFSGKRGRLKAQKYSGSFLPLLKARGRTTPHRLNGYIDGIWPLPDGNLLFAAGIQGRNYLYKLNPKTNTVGNNRFAYNNRQAVMNIGKNGRVHYQDIRILHQRSLLVAYNKQKRPVLYFGEYNVAYPRQDGKPSDWVTLWKSTNMGDTWTKVIRWNTKGHQTEHIHGLKQNPYNGWIYILLGDDDQEPGIVTWDGESKAPPDNTTIANIGRYKGWKAAAATQALRTSDIIFTKTKCIWVPDVDFIEPSGLRSMWSNHDLSNLQQVGKLPNAADHMPPVLSYMDNKGTVYWVSFRDSRSVEQKLYLWSSKNLGRSWELTKINLENDWTTVPNSLFKAPWGNELILSGRGTIFAKDQPSPTGYSAYLTLETR